MQETGLRFLGQENPPQRKWLPTPVFLPGELHGQRSRAGYSPWGHKESETTEQLTHTHTDKKLTTTGFSALSNLSFQSSTNPREKSRLRKNTFLHHSFEIQGFIHWSYWNIHGKKDNCEGNS